MQTWLVQRISNMPPSSWNAQQTAGFEYLVPNWFIRRTHSCVYHVFFERMLARGLPDLPSLPSSNLKNHGVLIIPVNVEAVIVPPAGIQVDDHSMVKQT